MALPGWAARVLVGARLAMSAAPDIQYDVGPRAGPISRAPGPAGGTQILRGSRDIGGLAHGQAHPSSAVLDEREGAAGDALRCPAGVSACASVSLVDVRSGGHAGWGRRVGLSPARVSPA